MCGAILVICAIKPYNFINKYLNLAFMDNMKVASSDDGLNLLENDIVLGYSSDTSSTGEVIYPAFGEQYAVLSCPSIDMSVPVYWGSNKTLLEKGACQSPSSAVVGNDGNSVIDAHVNTYFSNLIDLKVGDEVTINTKYGEFSYQVRELIEFDKTDKSYVNKDDENILTLYTCKIQVLGSSDIRQGVVCDLVEKKFYTNIQE